jgi:predicted Zn-dependent protease
LLALCDNEAQLAGVISHEIGHITARHAARRYTKSVGTNLILNVLGTLTNNQVTKNLMGQGAGLFLLSYSRSQEYEADKLALRYMNRAGFEPLQMANFLQLMENYSKIKSKILKIKNTGSELLRTHPNSSKRVNEVIVEANNVSQINPIIGRDIYLKKIDGLLFGHNQDEGFFLKDRFVHPKLQITFPLIDDFYFVNTPKKIIGINDNKSKIIYDIDESNNVGLKTYVASWAKKLRVKLGKLEARTVNNFEFLTGEATINSDQIILVVARDSESNYIHRFILISKKSDYKITKTKFIELTRSLRKIDDNEFSPPRIKVITANSDENFLKKTINSMNIQKKEAKLVFEILNKNLDFDNSSGKKIKIVY